jgi:hypothetical protein
VTVSRLWKGGGTCASSCTRGHKQCTAGGFDSAGEDAEVRKFRHYRVAVVERLLGDVNQTVGCSCAAEHNETARVTVDQTCLNGAFELGPTDFLTRHTSNEVAAGIDAERLTEEAKRPDHHANSSSTLASRCVAALRLIPPLHSRFWSSVSGA